MHSKYQNTTGFFFTQIWKTKLLHLQKHSNPFLISAKTPMTINQKHYYSVFSIDHFESNFVNSDKYRSENKPKKHIKNRKSSAAFQWTICGARQILCYCPHCIRDIRPGQQRNSQKRTDHLSKREENNRLVNI